MLFHVHRTLAEIPIQLSYLSLAIPYRTCPQLCAMFHPSLFAAELRRQERLVHRNKLKQDPALAAQLAESRLQPVTYREASPTLAPAIQVCLALVSIIQSGFCDKAWSWSSNPDIRASVMLKPGCLTCKLSVCGLCEGRQFPCHLHL